MITVRRGLATVAAAAGLCGTLVIAEATGTAPGVEPSATTRTQVTSAAAPPDDLEVRPTPAPSLAAPPIPGAVRVVQRVAPVPVVAGARPLTTRHRASLLQRDWLTSVDGSLDTGVAVYTDCSGASQLTRSSAAIDTCISGPTYFVGHNPGVFSPLMHMGVGAMITYDDEDGVAHVWRVVSVRPRWLAEDGAPPPTGPDIVAQFQTCAVPDGSIDRILDVVPV